MQMTADRRGRIGARQLTRGSSEPPEMRHLHTWRFSKLLMLNGTWVMAFPERLSRTMAVIWNTVGGMCPNFIPQFTTDTSCTADVRAASPRPDSHVCIAGHVRRLQDSVHAMQGWCGLHLQQIFQRAYCGLHAAVCLRVSTHCVASLEMPIGQGLRSASLASPQIECLSRVSKHRVRDVATKRAHFAAHANAKNAWASTELAVNGWGLPVGLGADPNDQLNGQLPGLTRAN
jgi:hypothetical protein